MRVLRTKKVYSSWLDLSIVTRLGISDRDFRVYCWFLTVHPGYEFTNVTLGEELELSRRQIEYCKKNLIDHELVFTDRASQHEYILYVGNGENTAVEVRKEYTDEPLDSGVGPFVKINPESVISEIL